MKLAVPLQSLDRGDLSAVMHGGQCQAGDDALAIDENGAGPASALVATLLRPGEIECFAQNVEQRLPKIDIQLLRLTVDVQSNRLHFLASSHGAASCRQANPADSHFTQHYPFCARFLCGAALSGSSAPVKSETG